MTCEVLCSLLREVQSSTSGGSIAAGGTVVLGQEQDSLGGRFSKSQAYTGKLYGVFVWKRVLTVSEILSFASDCTVSAVEDGVFSSVCTVISLYSFVIFSTLK